MAHAFLHRYNMHRPSVGKAHEDPCNIFLKAVNRGHRLISSTFREKEYIS